MLLCAHVLIYVYGACIIHSWGATLVSCYIYFFLMCICVCLGKSMHMLLRMSEEDIFCYIQATWAASVGAGNWSEVPGTAAHVLSIEPTWCLRQGLSLGPRACIIGYGSCLVNSRNPPVSASSTPGLEICTAMLNLKNPTFWKKKKRNIRTDRVVNPPSDSTPLS